MTEDKYKDWPEWANYQVTHKDGRVIHSEGKPVPSGTGWHMPTAKWGFANNACPHWRDTLEVREVDPYAELKAAAADPTKQIRLTYLSGDHSLWCNSGEIDWSFDRPPEDYEIRDKPKPVDWSKCSPHVKQYMAVDHLGRWAPFKDRWIPWGVPGCGDVCPVPEGVDVEREHEMDALISVRRNVYAGNLLLLETMRMTSPPSASSAWLRG